MAKRNVFHSGQRIKFKKIKFRAFPWLETVPYNGLKTECRSYLIIRLSRAGLGARSTLNAAFTLELSNSGFRTKSYSGEDFVGRFALNYGLGKLTNGYNEAVKPFYNEAVNIYSQVLSKSFSNEIKNALINGK
ncbi:hypothetical protein [Lacihabitans lacunae]|uniref:Uncharacterized protein n=1 Tax=Lacihabitans lacunae TaxID=1028214 RepID=A0ABV7YZT5_9BACT